jgi:predicted enzyme related to lactoylglutathione lyase
MSLPKPGAVLFAKDVAGLAAFYEQVVGLICTHEDASVRVLESELQQLVIHRIPAAIAGIIRITVPPQLREDTAVKLVFAVDSLERARAAAAACGGALQPPERSFEVHGFRACDGYDPEGNVLQFRAALS